MAWIKRNLFFEVGGLIALLLVGGGSFYIYKGWSRNADAFTALSQVEDTLKGLHGKNPSYGNNKIDNIKAANEQNQQLVEWMKQAGSYFQPIAAIPPGTNVDGASYSGSLQKTVQQLQREASAAGVSVPQQFGFSFTAEKDRVTFAPAGLNALAAQLGEVKVIAETLFGAKINAIDSIQRVRVSDDDTGGPQADYLDRVPTTNTLAVITPYVFTIRCFTPELSRVLTSFATAGTPFIVRAVNIQRAAGGTSVATGPNGTPPMQPQGIPYYGMNGMAPGGPGAVQQPGAGKGGLPTVLKEQLLSITVEVDLVKLLPKT